MNPRRGRLLAWGTVGGGLLVLVACAVVFQYPLAEQYYVWRLESDSLEARKAAAERLTEMGSPRSPTLICRENLKVIYSAANDFFLTRRMYPVGRGRAPRAHESLNVLLRSGFSQALRPATFVCRAGEATPAEMDENGNFLLREENLSYSWFARRPRLGLRPRPLASDKYFHGYEDKSGKYKGHVGYVHVLYTDGSIRTFDIERDRDMLNDDYLPYGLTR